MLSGMPMATGVGDVKAPLGLIRRHDVSGDIRCLKTAYAQADSMLTKDALISGTLSPETVKAIAN